MYVHTHVHYASKKPLRTVEYYGVACSKYRACVLRCSLACVRTTVLGHGCSGEGRLATRMTAQRFSRPMSLLLLHHELRFRSLFTDGCIQPFDTQIVRAWAYAMLYVNLYGPQLLYSLRKFGQVFLTRTVRMFIHM